MAKDKRSDEVFDAMLRKALKEEFMSSMDHLPSEESMKHKFSERHQKNMKDLFASDLQKDDHKADPRKTETDNVVRLYQELEVNQENNNEKRRWKKSRLWQTAGIGIAAAAIVAGVFVLRPQSVQANLGEGVEKDYGIYKVEQNGDGNINIDQMHAPDYIPDGYSLTDELEGAANKMLYYTNDNGDYIRIQYWATSHSSQNGYDSEYHNYASEEVWVKDIYKANYLVPLNDSKDTILYWDNGIIRYTITSGSGFGKDVLIKIGNSIMR